jgi:hypothetical protein
MSAEFAQQNQYEGVPERAWVRVRLMQPSGNLLDRELLADTGNPCAIIVGAQDIALTATSPGQSLHTNFGWLTGGWVRLIIPEVGFDQKVLGYGSDAVVNAAKSSSPDFSGLIGLPLLRMMQYGGDANSFWISPAGNSPGT